MKTLRLVAVILLVLVQCAMAAEHGFLHAAISSLHRAEQTMDAKDLRAAKTALERAIEVAKESNKPLMSGLSMRTAAHEQVLQALKALEAKDQVTASKCIKKAINAADGAARIKLQ